jgi:2-polyprenyl-3-methyl-5-hydroxy-6-metoxy-1,4-benzoquinol methylase
MKILVAIANYGMKNMAYLRTLIEEYSRMSYNVDIVVLSNISKNLGSNIEVIVGLPAKDPWSLPFAHKKIFAERKTDYDLFIYTEDDTLITEQNISAFLEVTKILPEDEIAGFMRYEVDPSGRKNISTVHGHFHWIPNSVKRIRDYTLARFTNDHSGCFLLTQSQLKRAIDSGGFMRDPYRGKYDLLCTAATDPYTQCGFKKMICISHINSFLLHHLPNKYIGKFGIVIDEFEMQIEAMLSNNFNSIKGPLFKTEANLATTKWHKQYYEPCDENIIELIPDYCKNILSVGCGRGATEAGLLEKGMHVVGIPLDSVIAPVARAKGIEIVPPDFNEALSMLANRHFDCIIFSDILQHLEKPAEILSRFTNLLSPTGLMIISIPNFNHIKALIDAFGVRKRFKRNDDFQKAHLHFMTKNTTKRLFFDCGFKNIRSKYIIRSRYRRLAQSMLGLLNKFLASGLLLVAKKT